MANAPTKLRGSSGLASEFYVTYQLYRRGYVAVVTYGNTKALDIIAANPTDNRTATIEVKSLKNKTNWPLTLHDEVVKRRHFYALVGYSDRWEEPNVLPDVWVIPASAIRRFLVPWSRSTQDRTCVGYRDLVRRGARYKDAWHLLFP
jgi:hypothetical protein